MRDARIWAFVNLTRAALRAGRTFVVLFACVLAYATIACGLAACGVEQAAEHDAGIAALPPCSSVGCASGDEICKRDGQCSCPQANGVAIECQRVAPPPDASTEPDAAAQDDACGAACAPRIDAP